MNCTKCHKPITKDQKYHRTMRGAHHSQCSSKHKTLEVKVGEAICRAEGEFEWKYLQDVDGNPSTAYAYKRYIKMAKAAIKAIG